MTTYTVVELDISTNHATLCSRTHLPGNGFLARDRGGDRRDGLGRDGSRHLERGIWRDEEVRGRKEVCVNDGYQGASNNHRAENSARGQPQLAFGCSRNLIPPPKLYITSSMLPGCWSTITHPLQIHHPARGDMDGPSAPCNQRGTFWNGTAAFEWRHTWSLQLDPAVGGPLAVR